MIKKILKKLRRRMDKHSDKFNKELGNKNKNQAELKSTKTEIKTYNILYMCKRMEKQTNRTS